MNFILKVLKLNFYLVIFLKILLNLRIIYMIFNLIFFKILNNLNKDKLIIGDWGLGIGDLGFGVGAKPQFPNPQSPTPTPQPQQNQIFIHLIN